MDNNDNHLLGDLQNELPELMEEIYHQQTVVGRLGLYSPEMLPHPQDKLFLRTKSTHFLGSCRHDGAHGFRHLFGTVLVPAETGKKTH